MYIVRDCGFDGPYIICGDESANFSHVSGSTSQTLGNDGGPEGGGPEGGGREGGGPEGAGLEGGGGGIGSSLCAGGGAGI